MLVALAGLALLADLQAASKLLLAVNPNFTNGRAEDGLAIDVENNGQDAKGVVRVSSSGGVSLYPIELPRGAKKHFVAYPMRAPEYSYEQIEVLLDTDRGSIQVSANNDYTGDQGQLALEISDETGGLQFLADSAAAPAYPGAPVAGKACYAKPEDAPARLSAYASAKGVVLGAGAERMSDGAVAALKEYVIAGGRLVLVGGSGSPVFRDPRWADTIPITGLHAETRDISIKANGARFKASLSVQAGTPLPGSIVMPGGVIVHYQGLGGVIVIPFDILDGPAKKWLGRPKFLSSLLATQTGADVWQGAGPGNEYGYGYGYGGPMRRYGGSYPGAMTAGAPRRDDPFAFEPPRPETVLWIILCYLVLVAPVNFLILRKLRRSELAWFTTPLISFVFAGFLLKLAAGLYLGKMMTESRGTLLVSEHMPNGVFRGSTQLFFPTGGSYDLGLSGVDQISSGDANRYGAPSLNAEPLTAVDADQFLVPGLSVHNLQFKELTYEQLVDAKELLSLSARRVGNKLEVAITNRSPYELSGGSVFIEGKTQSTTQAIDPGLTIAPGATVHVSVPTRSSSGLQDPETGESYLATIADPLGRFSMLSHRTAFRAKLRGFRPGPQVGSEGADKGEINVVWVGEPVTGVGS